MTVFGALEVTTGQWAYRLGRHRASDFAVFLDQLLRAFPRAPAIVVICDNNIHHARAVTHYLEEHPRLELLYGARYSPHDNPVERIWAGLKNYAASLLRGAVRTQAAPALPSSGSARGDGGAAVGQPGQMIPLLQPGEAAASGPGAEPARP